MINQKSTAAAALLFLAFSPLRAQPSAEALHSGADNLSAAFSALSQPSQRLRAAAAVQLAASRFRAASLPEDCANLPVVSVRNGEIFKNDQRLGDNASSYQANCDGVVAWLDNSGSLYRDAAKVADGVSQYDVAWHGDTVAWKDSSGDLHRDNDDFGRVQTYTFVKYTGDVVWTDGWSDLYRDRQKLGRVQYYAVAGRTGDVAWMDDFGTLYRNLQALGRAQNWQICDRTGDVGWLDSFQNLYKNGAKVGTGVNQFTLREDGRLIWVDGSGVTHSA